MALRHVDPTRRPGVFARAYAALAVTRLARFISRHVSWKLDPVLLRATRGRIASTLMFPSAVLETRGVKSGARRRNAIIYFHDGERVIVAASNAGGPRNPSWYYNLRAHPDVVFGGIAMRAAVVEDGTERNRLWQLADNVFPAFGRYRTDAAKVNRVIPIVQLVRR
jgi:deazaflavin-dependent oxidoreductase (nitroreductase family)